MTWRVLVSPFDVRRNGDPILELRVRDSVNANITHTMLYSEWDAAIAAGATLDELSRLDQYPVDFRARLIAWHQLHTAIEAHVQDAINQKMSKKHKR